MAVKGVDETAVGQNMLNDDDPFISIPAFRFGIENNAVTDAVDGGAEVCLAGRCPPIFAGVIFIIPLPENGEVAPARSHFGGVGRIDGEVQHVYDAAANIALRRGIMNHFSPGISGNGQRDGGWGGRKGRCWGVGGGGGVGGCGRKGWGGGGGRRVAGSGGGR